MSTWYHFKCAACGNAVSTEDPDHPNSPFPCLACGKRAGWTVMTELEYKAAKAAEAGGKEGVFDTYGEHAGALGPSRERSRPTMPIHSVRSEEESQRREELLGRTALPELTQQLDREHEQRDVDERLEMAKIEAEYRQKRQALVVERNSIEMKLDPNYWATALLTSRFLREQTTDADMQVLANVTDLSTESKLEGKTVTKRVTLKLNANAGVKEDTLWIQCEHNVATEEVTTSASGYTVKKKERGSKKRVRDAADDPLALVALFLNDADPQAQMDLVEIFESVELNGAVQPDEEDEEDEEEEEVQ